MKNAVRHGIFMTAKDGRNAAKRNSRVDTGRLRRGWNIHVEDWNESDIYNYVPYANIWARSAMAPSAVRYLDSKKS